MKDNESIVRKMLNGFRGFGMPADHCMTILFALVLRYIELDKKAEIDPFALRSLSFTYGETIDIPQIENYVKEYFETITPQYRHISDGVGEMLKRTDRRDVKNVFAMVSEFEDTELIKEILDALIKELSRENNKSRYDIVPSESIIKLEKAFLNCGLNDKVYDPFCGMGISVSSVARDKGTVYVEDIDPYAVSIASVILFLKGIKVGEIKYGDTYQNPIEETSYDFIVSEPPIMTKNDREYLSRIQYTNIEFPEYRDPLMIPVQHILKKLGAQGTAVVIMPVGSLFRSGRTADVRRCVVENNLIDAVIELAPGTMRGTMMPFAMLVLKKNKESDEVVLVDVKKLAKSEQPYGYFYDDDTVKDIVQIVRTKELRDAVSCVVTKKEIEQKDYSLLPSEYLAAAIDIDNIDTDTTEINRECETIMRDIIAIDKELNSVRSRFV